MDEIVNQKPEGESKKQLREKASNRLYRIEQLERLNSALMAELAYRGLTTGKCYLCNDFSKIDCRNTEDGSPVWVAFCPECGRKN